MISPQNQQEFESLGISARPSQNVGTILSTRSNATRQEWEKAFDRAKARTEPDEDPVIMDSDFL